MRYRAKKDFSVTTPEGREVLIAKGDKVYIEQSHLDWKIFSFYTRELLCVRTEEFLTEHFGREEEFKRAPQDKFKGRNFNKSPLMILLVLMPILGMSQVNLVSWSSSSKKVGSNFFEVYLHANISRGWSLYEPNRPEACPFSPSVIFYRNSYAFPLGEIRVIKQVEPMHDSLGCRLDRYSSSVVFSQLFQVTTSGPILISGVVKWQAVSKYGVEEPVSTDFIVEIGSKKYIEEITMAQRDHSGVIYTTYPRGIFRKIWHRIKHPFGPSWVKKEVK